MIIGKGSGETNQTNVLVRLFHAADGPRNNALQDGTTLVVQQVDLIDDDETHKVGVTGVGLLAGNNIPLLRRRDNDLGLSNLLLCNLGVPCELADFDTKDLEALGKVSNHFLHEGLHRGDVNALVSVMVELACFLVTMFGDLVEDG